MISVLILSWRVKGQKLKVDLPPQPHHDSDGQRAGSDGDGIGGEPKRELVRARASRPRSWRAPRPNARTEGGQEREHFKFEMALLTLQVFGKVLEEGCRTYGARNHCELDPSPPENGGLG